MLYGPVHNARVFLLGSLSALVLGLHRMGCEQLLLACTQKGGEVWGGERILNAPRRHSLLLIVALDLLLPRQGLLLLNLGVLGLAP